MFRKKIVGAAVAGTAAVVVSAAGVAQAVSTYRTGGITDRQYVSTSTDPFSAPTSFGWTTVPNTQVNVSITGRRHLLTARFGAESDCTVTAPATGTCAVRIVYRNGSGSVTELAPQSGTDFAFDAPDGAAASSRFMERTSGVYLPTGNYRVSVQARRVGASTFTLDDYHLNVGTIAPS